MSSIQEIQAIYRAQMAYGEENPEWMALALAALNRWGRTEATLVHAVAEAIAEAHAMGMRGENPEPPAPPAPPVFRRSRAAPPPPPTILRRTRR